MSISNLKLLFFKTILSALFLFGGHIVHAADVPRTNPLQLNIDTLRASYTSGGGSFQVKGSIFLSFKLPAGIIGTVYMKNSPTSGYIAIGNYGNSASTTIQTIKAEFKSLNVRDDIYCFYIEAKEISGTISYSRELCSIPFFKEPKNTDDNKNVLEIASYQPGTDSPNDKFRPIITSKCLDKFGCVDEDDDFVTNTKNVAPYRARKSLNAIVKCGETKVFQVKITINNMVSLSDTLQNIGKTNTIPTKLSTEWAWATVENDLVKLIWKNDLTKVDTFTIEKKFIVSRKDNNGTFVQLTTPKTLIRQNAGDSKSNWEFLDTTSKPTTIKHSYELKYEDFCGNVSFPINVYPIYLRQDDVNFDLIWDDENNSRIDQYELEYYDETNLPARKSIAIPSGNSNRFSPPETANYYKLKGKQKRGDGSNIFSNFTLNNEKIIVYNPTVFTPDGKGPIKSETFKVFCKSTATFNIYIYDRNGQLVYFSDNYFAHNRDGWDGKLIYTDLDAEEGTYVFQVNVTNKNKVKFSKKGAFQLVRDH